MAESVWGKQFIRSNWRFKSAVDGLLSGKNIRSLKLYKHNIELYNYQQQTQNQNWFSSDGNYGGAFSSNSNYDSSQSKQ